MRDLLLAEGVEFPCGGDGTCGDCKIRVLQGSVPVTPAMREFLSESELHGGWRLGCCAAASGADGEAVQVEVRQWQTVILSDDVALAFERREGFGAAVDLGTTTVVVQCVDLSTGEIAGSESALNEQARYGADVMSRVQHAIGYPRVLGAHIRAQIGAMLGAAAGGRALTEVLLAGNTVMHHLFCGLDVEPLASVPFRSGALGARSFAGVELGWDDFNGERGDFSTLRGRLRGERFAGGFAGKRAGGGAGRGSDFRSGYERRDCGERWEAHLLRFDGGRPGV